MRRIAKIVNFGIIYGISAHGLKAQAKLPSRHDAQKLIDSYLQRFKVVKEWRENIIKEAEKKGFVRTIFGRLRYIPELKSEDKNIRAEGERRAINTPIQGSAADIMKIAMISVWNRLKKEVPEAKIIMQVHDELIVECPEEKSDKVKEILEEEMRLEEKLKFSVPLKVSVKIGKKWSELD
jgi:DNA polymerase I (EC 2.7.7.7)